MEQWIAALLPLANSKVAAAIAPAIVSALLGALTALIVYWAKSREPLDGAIAWQWQNYPDGQQTEGPFLVLQNRSNVPAYLKRARLLRGNFIRREASRYAFSYLEMTDGNFPLEVTAAGVSGFPLSQHMANRVFDKARWFNKLISYLLKRPYLWVEVTTLSGRRIVVAANDAADFRDRPLWIDLRWLPPPAPLWSLPKADS